MKNATMFKKLIQQSIARRFIFYIVVFSAVITLILTALQLFKEYREGLSVIANNIAVVEESHLDSIVNTLWISDLDLLQIQLNGMVKLADMQHIIITDGTKVVAEVGTSQDEHAISKSFNRNNHLLNSTT